jgi:SprT-like family
MITLTPREVERRIRAEMTQLSLDLKSAALKKRYPHLDDREPARITANLAPPLTVGHTESPLRRYLEESLGRPVSLVLTDNSTSMLSARVRDGVLRVRLHWMFAAADSQVLDEIVSFLSNTKRAMPCFRRFVRDHGEQLRKRPPNRVPVKTRGRVYDLRELYRELNEEYFDNTVNAVVTWGSSNSRDLVRKRTLGSYSERSHTIRINPVLDKRTVPRSVVAFVVYHEMLHAAIGISRQGGRRSVHSREFRKRERLFKDYEKAMAWERMR